VAAVVMKHSTRTYTLVGIAASEFADNTHQDENALFFKILRSV
jgi:hypothetical protein